MTTQNETKPADADDAELRFEERKVEFYRLQRLSEAEMAWREYTGNVNGFGS